MNTNPPPQPPEYAFEPPPAAPAAPAGQAPTGPHPALMLVLGLLSGVLIGLGIAYGVWHTS